MGVPEEEQLQLIEKIASDPDTGGLGSRRHPVWSDPESMLEQFEQRLHKLMQRADMDGDGFVSRQEFRQIVVEHFRYRVEAEEGEALDPEDLSKLEKVAYKEFKMYDKDKNRRLDLHELRRFFKEQIEFDIVEDNHLGK